MIHFIKYNLIGLLNTGVTVMVVFVLHQLLAVNIYVANFLGYVVGGVNSYLWNRLWNFKSQNQHGPEVMRFVVVFALSYLLNLGVLMGSEKLLLHMNWGIPWLKTGFVAHVIANVVYVLASFGLYKKWVFASKS